MRKARRDQASRSKSEARDSPSATRPERKGAAPSELRIVGGKLRSRKLIYSGDARTRPMKERVREAVFNLLAADVVGAHAIDLFAGSGALGLEAISRGSRGATFVERHFPTAALVRQNAAALGVADVCDIRAADVLLWARQPDLAPTDAPWLVFCSPPFDFYVERPAEVLEMLARLMAAAPSGSVFVVEADERFDMGRLPDAAAWRVRAYPPARIAISRKPDRDRESDGD